MREFKDILLMLIKKQVPVQSVIGKVKSVDKSECTCDVDPEDGGPDMLNVRIRAVIDNNEAGIMVFPKVGSFVVVSLLGNNLNSAYISKFSDYESISIKGPGGVDISIKESGNVEVETNGDVRLKAAGNIVLNQGINGGLININALRLEIAKNTAAILAIQTAFNAWTVAPADGGAALKATSASFTSLPLASLGSHIEDQKVKH